MEANPEYDEINPGVPERDARGQFPTDLGQEPERDPPPEALYNLGLLSGRDGGLYGPLDPSRWRRTLPHTDEYTGAPMEPAGQWDDLSARWFALAVEKALRDTGSSLGRII